MNNPFLCEDKKLQKLSNYHVRYRNQRIEIFSLSKNIIRLLASKKNLFDKIGENGSRDYVSATIHDLNSAQDFYLGSQNC